MRLTTIGVIGDALWVGPLHVLWGRGQANRVLVMTSYVAASSLLLNLLLIPHFGALGAAIAFAVSTWIGAIIAMIEAARGTGSSWLKPLVASFSKVAAPSIALAICTIAVSVLLGNDSKLLLLVSIAAGSIVYGGLFLVQQRLWDRSSKA
jgi:O-antigen/teichoic acid export membrane protein